MNRKKPVVTKKSLQKRIVELEAQIAGGYHFASLSLHRAAEGNLMGSAVVLELTALGGNPIVSPIAILDGLSKETIEALQKDIVRSYEKATEFKPKGAK